MESVRKRDLPLRNPSDFSDNLPYQVPKQFFSFWEHVDAAGLNRWLEANPDWTSFRFTQPGQETKQTSVKTGRQRWREKICEALIVLGYDPKALPRSKTGTPGVRSAVAQKLGFKSSDRAFEHRWQRALNEGVIAFRD